MGRVRVGQAAVATGTPTVAAYVVMTGENPHSKSTHGDFKERLGTQISLLGVGQLPGGDDRPKTFFEALPGVGADAPGLAPDELAVFIMALPEEPGQGSPVAAKELTLSPIPGVDRWKAFDEVRSAVAVVDQSTAPIDHVLLCFMRPSNLGHVVDADADVRAAQAFFSVWAEAKGHVGAVVDAVWRNVFCGRGGEGTLYAAFLDVLWQGFPFSVSYTTTDYDQQVACGALPPLLALLPGGLGEDLMELARKPVDDVVHKAYVDPRLVRVPGVETIIAYEILAKATGISCTALISYYQAVSTMQDPAIKRLQGLLLWPDGATAVMVAKINGDGNQDAATAAAVPYCRMPVDDPGQTLREVLSSVMSEFNARIAPVLLLDSTEPTFSLSKCTPISFDTIVGELPVHGCGVRAWVTLTAASKTDALAVLAAISRQQFDSGDAQTPLVPLAPAVANDDGFEIQLPAPGVDADDDANASAAASQSLEGAEIESVGDGTTHVGQLEEVVQPQLDLPLVDTTGLADDAEPFDVGENSSLLNPASTRVVGVAAWLEPPPVLSSSAGRPESGCQSPIDELELIQEVQEQMVFMARGQAELRQQVAALSRNATQSTTVLAELTDVLKAVQNKL